MSQATLERVDEGAARPLTATSQSKSPLPSLKALARSSGTAVIVVAALALLLKHAFFGAGVVCGGVVCLLMYTGIYSFVNGAGAMLLQTVGGRAGIDPKGFMPQFALLTLGKFVLVGALLYLMLRVLHVGIVAMLIGFFIAQIVITVQCARSLNGTPLVG